MSLLEIGTHLNAPNYVPGSLDEISPGLNDAVTNMVQGIPQLHSANHNDGHAGTSSSQTPQQHVVMTRQQVDQRPFHDRESTETTVLRCIDRLMDRLHTTRAKLQQQLDSHHETARAYIIQEATLSHSIDRLSAHIDEPDLQALRLNFTNGDNSRTTTDEDDIFSSPTSSTGATYSYSPCNDFEDIYVNGVDGGHAVMGSGLKEQKCEEEVGEKQ